MAENSKIGWTHHTWNPWLGCNKVTIECDNCYIGPIIARMGKEPFGGPFAAKTTWGKPYRWNRLALAAGERHRVFTCSMSDFFHVKADGLRQRAWDIIRDCKQLDWLILTKRSKNVLSRLPKDWGDGWDHVWLGCTVGHSQSYYRLDDFKNIPAKVKFISSEPLFEELDLTPWLPDFDWVITGCEQVGKDDRRCMDLDWVRSIDRQAQAAGIPHYFKQYYRRNSAGEEYGVPETDGILDGVKVQNFPATPVTMYTYNGRAIQRA